MALGGFLSLFKAEFFHVYAEEKNSPARQSCCVNHKLKHLANGTALGSAEQSAFSLPAAHPAMPCVRLRDLRTVSLANLRAFRVHRWPGLRPLMSVLVTVVGQDLLNLHVPENQVKPGSPSPRSSP